jgi:hypothetical protein
MSFRALNQKWLVPLSELTMVFGIIALCQPWVELLHRYGITIVLIGLIGFSVLTKFGPHEAKNEDAA